MKRQLHVITSHALFPNSFRKAQIVRIAEGFPAEFSFGFVGSRFDANLSVIKSIISLRPFVWTETPTVSATGLTLAKINSLFRLIPVVTIRIH